MSLLIVTKVSCGPARVRAWLNRLNGAARIRADPGGHISQHLIEVEHQGEPVQVRLARQRSHLVICHNSDANQQGTTRRRGAASEGEQVLPERAVRVAVADQPAAAQRASEPVGDPRDVHRR